ncbi:hypothetical protein AB0C70_27080 [Streptomyces sp. NPDC048564]|uniref:hypothetical protein n=1 Tax=Streptomyces sp. NPDC048564 TaxID=3155760 RepID=UPI0034169089
MAVRPVGGVPLIQAAEETSEFAEAVADGVPVQRSSAGGRPLQQPLPVAFDVPPLELSHAGDVRAFGGDQEGKLPQRQLGVLHGARPRRPGDLLQIVLHRLRHPGRDAGPFAGSHVGPIRGASPRELVGQLAVEQGGFEIEQGGRQGLDAAVGDAACGVQQETASLVPVALLQFVGLVAEQRHEVTQQVELGHGHRVAKAECAGGLHEPHVQFRLRAGEHDPQSRAPCDQVFRARLHPSRDRKPADEPVGLVVEGELTFQWQATQVGQVRHCRKQCPGTQRTLWSVFMPCAARWAR